MDIPDDPNLTSECFNLFSGLWNLVPFTAETFPSTFILNIASNYDAHKFFYILPDIARQAIAIGMYDEGSIGSLAEGLLNSFFLTFVEEYFEPAFELLFFISKRVTIAEIIEKVISENNVPQDIHDFFGSVIEVMTTCSEEAQFSSVYQSDFIVQLARFINWRQNKPY